MAGKITDETVRHIAHLSRLKLTEEEVARFGEQLSAILAYVEQLNELDTSQVETSAHALSVHNVFREDVVRESLTADQALANAPQRDGSFFKVPKVLDQDST